MESKYFSGPEGCQVEVVPNPSGEGYLCPAFDPETFHCRIYEVRPLDCQIYPFVLMWNQQHQTIILGWDTKCPFLYSSNDENCPPQDVSSLTVLPTLPAEMIAAANQLSMQLEESSLKISVADHPHLVTPFQDDVVIIQSLPKLTRAVGAE